MAAVDTPDPGPAHSATQSRRGGSGCNDGPLQTSPTLRGQLTWLVIAALLPFVPLLAGIIIANYYAARDSAARMVAEVARGTALSIERELRATVVSLEALALSPSLAANDLDAFRREADTLARRYFPGASIALLDLDGQQFFNTFKLDGSPLPRRPNLEALHRVQATGQPAVSDVFMASLQKTYIVPVDAPVFGPDGKVHSILSLAPPLQVFEDVIRQQHPQPGWVISVLDRNGVVVARTPDGARFVGHPANEAFRTLLASTAEGTADVVALDGSKLLAGWSRPGPSGWSVAIGIPHSQLYPALWRTLIATLAVSVLTLLGALLLARIVAGRIARPVQALARHAATPSTVSAPTLGLREADAVLGALRAAIEERYAAETRLRSLEADSRAELERRIEERTAELQTAQAQLLQAQRMEAVGQLTAGVAHDFNNLLQAQMAGLELLLSTLQGQDRATRYARLALTSAERGATLTHSLLSFSRTQLLRPETVAIPVLLDRLHVLLSRTLDPGIQLLVTVEPGIAPVMADPAQLESALLNLCLNARDAMAQPGASGRRLQIEAAAATFSSPEGLADPASFIMLVVSDDGCGMDAATLARACEPFFTTKHVGRGSGLGLSMVQGFARQSGGGLRIQSAAGVGTRIEIWLPRALSSSSEGQIGTSAAIAHLPMPGRVLLVDDEPLLCELMTETLESAGFEVVQASSGDDALTILKNSATAPAFDALLTDYAMPGMKGTELVDAARKHWPGLPALVITGYALAERSVKVADGIEIMQKPFRIDQLASRVTRLIEAHTRSGSAPAPSASKNVAHPS